MKHLKNVPEYFSSSKEISAKKFALIRSDVVKNMSATEISFEEKLAQAEEFELRGEYESAAQSLAPRWADLTAEINLSGLSELCAARLLLRAGSILSSLGTSEQIKNSQDTARDFLCKAERFFDELDDLEGKAQCQNKIGVTYWRNGDMSVAINYFQQSFEYAKTDESKAIALLNISMAEFNLEHAETAFEYGQRAYAYIGKISAHTEYRIRNRVGLSFKNLINVAVKEDKSKYFDLAIIEYEGALACCEEIGNLSAALVIRNNIGFLHYTRGQFSEALDVLEPSKTIAYKSKDKIHISLICDTLARVYIALEEYNDALKNSAIAIKYLEINENSNRLSTYLCIHGVGLARAGRTDEAKRTFYEAEHVADYIGDRTLAAQSKLFALREFFSEYSEEERVSIFDDARRRLENSQEKDIVDAIADIEAKIEGREIAPENDSIENPVFNVDIDAEINAFQRPYFERAIEAANGNQSKAAEMLGLSRPTFKNRIDTIYPDLRSKLKKIGKAKKEKIELFPSHLIYNPQELKQHKIAISIIEDDMPPRVKGDALLISLGKWHVNSLIAFRSRLSGELKIGCLRSDGEYYAIENKQGEQIKFTESDFNNIVGEIVGFCPVAEYQKYLKRRLKDSSAGLPYVLF